MLYRRRYWELYQHLRHVHHLSPRELSALRFLGELERVHAEAHLLAAR